MTVLLLPYAFSMAITYSHSPTPNQSLNPDSLIAKGEFKTAFELCGQKIHNLQENDDSLKLYGSYAYLCSRLGYYHDAILWGEKVVALSGTGKPYADALNDLARYNSRASKYIKAIELGELALHEYEKSTGRSADYAAALNNLSHYKYKTGDFAAATNLCLQAKEILEREAPNSLDYSNVLSNLSHYKSRTGEYPEAISLCEEAMRIYALNSDTDHPDYAVLLSDMATYYSRMGDYLKARDYEKQAMAIRAHKLGRNHPDYAVSLTHLAHYLYKLGDIEEAVKIGLRGCEIRESVLPPHHLDYLEGKTDLAKYYAASDSIAKAITLAEEVKETRGTFYGTDNTDYANLISNLGVYYALTGSYDKAIDLERESLEIKQRRLSPSHPNIAKSLTILATYYLQTGKAAEALEYSEKALSIQKLTLGEEHPDILAAMATLAACGFSANDAQKGSLYSRLTTDRILNRIRGTFRDLTNHERRNLWETHNLWLTEKIHLYTYLYGVDQMTTSAYDAILFAKGILLNSEIEFGSFLLENGNQDLLEKFNELETLHKWLNSLYEKPIADREVSTDSLERVGRRLERALVEGCKEFGDYTRNLSITWQDVQNSLKERDVAIEFVSFELNQDSTMYMAYILKPGMEAPEMVKLFEEKELEPYRNPNRYHKREATELVWGKLRPYLEGCENIYFAPDGLLHQIAIEYFPDFEGTSRISDHYDIHRLSSTRQLAITRDNAHSRKAVVYGGIQYDVDLDTMKEESRKYTNPNILSIRDVTSDYTIPDSLKMRTGFGPLEATGPEAVFINETLINHHYASRLVLGSEASEESFKNLSGIATEIIHIATHGFYWSEEQAHRAATNNDNLFFMNPIGENIPRYREDIALTRSGLCMAGANNAFYGDIIPDSVDDGILTAREIAQLNLRGTDLVVLSACQSALGEIGSDGVFGLQRGFKKAGVNSLLMSLWKVDDEATRILMEAFYSNLMEGQSKMNALRNAQSQLRTSGYDNPQFWAAFILLDAMN